MNLSQIRYFKNILQNRCHNFFHKELNGKSIYIIPPPHGEMRRYLYLLAKFFVMNGYKVFVKAQFNIFKKLVDYSHFFLDETNIILVNGKVKANYTITYQKTSVTNEIQMKYNYFGEEEGLYFPYPMQPGQYKFNYINNIDSLRSNKRMISSLFIGGISDYYKDNENLSPFKKKYGILSRHEVYNFLLKEAENVIVPKSSEEAISCFETKKRIDKSLLVNTINCIIVQPEWLKCISKSDFIICLPGTGQPMCHHTIEAMSVGTIPILQYDMLFNPYLENMKNCIVFKDLDELRTILSEIKLIPSDKIEELRKNVITYYDNYLTPASFIRSFEKYMINNCLDKRLFINIENPHSIAEMR